MTDYISWHALYCFKCEKKVCIIKRNTGRYILCPECYDKFIKEVPHDWAMILP